ncbi:MAG: glucose 1-dehydrogenase [SAR202 cluster bacterium]|nr:glucose 1-dehydrogenase [SAR202 cluster bacterium]|tara:strand:+ start:3694 stop:4470 length:777 start_codon:yes stop_codon:yes gene_type:complete
MRLKDKVALITGGGNGIGRSTAELFSKEGAKVIVSDLHESGIMETIESIRSLNLEADSIVGDVTVFKEAELMIRTVIELHGRLDILVNSAGIGGVPPMDGSTHEDRWDKVIDVNLKGTYLPSWFAVPEMERSGGGSIINLASIIALVGYDQGSTSYEPGFNPYAASKGAVLQFTRNLAVQCAKKNIRVNCICPGYIYTNMTKSLTENPVRLSQLEGLHPMGRLGRPEEIASAALFLASDESSFVTGTPLVVDGGYTAQ